MTTKGMSPLRSLVQSSPRKPPYQDSSSNENAQDLGSGSASFIPSRAPLCPIPLPSQLAEGIGNGDATLKGKPQVSTPRGKSKMQQRTDNSGGTPDKHTATGTFVQARNRFGWHQPRFQAITGMEKESSSAGSSLFSPSGKHGQESPCPNEGKEIRTPSKLLRSSSFSESSHSSDGVGPAEGQLNSNCVQNLNRAGHSNQSTPRSAKSLKSSDPSNAGVCQLNGTPNRNVSRMLKYLANNAPSSSGSSGSRLTLPGLRLTGPPSQQTRSAQPYGSDFQCVDAPYFEVEEDPSFWNDHNVQVLIRCRPLNSSEISSHGYSRCLKQETAHTVTWIGQPESRFTFDHVVCEKITQEKLFKVAGIPMVDNCMSGYNSCMFAYGQTGSGKTHTMLGDIGDLEQRPRDNRGMTPRIFEYLFRRISMEEEMRENEKLKFTCKCSFLEIYNEQITDLLEPSATNLQMREDLKKGVYVESLSEVEVKSVQDVVFLLLQGAANRRVAATNMNQESSRSHSVFTCVIESKWESDSMTNIRFGRLNLVDLAGSERQKSSGAEGERLKEAASINKSLSTLGLVIMILVDVAQGKQRHVPYRDSKLTFLLQDSLGGNSKTTIIANVSPSVSCAAETLSTLKFAQRAKFIRNNAIVNEDASGDVLALRLQIQQLKEELNRLSRQSISRIPLSSRVMSLEFSSKDVCNGGSAADGWFSKSEESSEAALEKVKALEAVVAGSLRREKAADDTAKRLSAEIEQLNCLVRQREDDVQFNKMMLRFREEKVRRLEATLDGTFSAEYFKSEELQALKEELDLMRGRLDRNPELTRFAMENIRLREQFQRLQDFYEGGDREILLEEISDLRDQLSKYLEAKFAGEDNMLDQMMGKKVVGKEEPNENWFPANNPEEGNTILKLESLLQEKEARIQWETYRADELNGQLENARHSISVLKNELKDSKEAAEVISNRLQLCEASLAAAQETAASAQATVQQVRIETEDIALQQRQSFSEIQEATTAWRLQELQLRAQLEDAQNIIKELSTQNNPPSQSAGNESRPAAAETLMQLQVELEALDCLVQEERSYRKEAEDKNLSVSMQLEESEEKCNWLRTQINEAEARIEQLSKEFEKAEEKDLEMSKRLLETAEDLNNHKLVVESLENQAVLSISEIDNLQTENMKLTEALKDREDKLKVVTGCVVFLQSELQRELEVHVLEMEASAIKHDSDVKEKLERTRKALEQAEQLNSKLQNEQNTLRDLEHEKELVRADAEMETTEAITVLQSELISLCKDHKIIEERELKAEQKITQLKMDVVALEAKVKALCEENGQLNILYQNALKAKDAEISKLTQEWEMAASNLLECLSEGNQTLDDASQEMDTVSELCPMQGNIRMSVESPITCKEQNVVENLERRLLHAQKLAKQTEDKVRSLSDASLAIADKQKQERIDMQNDLDALNALLIENSNHISCQHAQLQNIKGRSEKFEKLFLAACLIINNLSEAGSELGILNQRMQQLVDKTAASNKEKETEIYCLQLERRKDQVVLEEREAVILNNEQQIENLSKELQDLVHQKKTVENNYESMKSEEQIAEAKFTIAEKEIEKLTCQLVSTEQTLARLLVELSLANSYKEDYIVSVFQVQVLEDFLSFQEKVGDEKFLQSQLMHTELEAQYQSFKKDLDDRICLLEARNEALLVDLTNERNISLQLRKDVEDNTSKLSEHLKIFEEKFLAEQGYLQHQYQESCIEADDLQSQNALLMAELNQRNSYAAEIEVRLQKLLTESSDRLLAVMESWSRDSIAAIVEAELLKCQVCLMSEDQSLCESQQELMEKYYHDQINCCKRESLALTQKIFQADVIVQELKDKLQTSSLELGMSQLQAAQAEQDGIHLSLHLKNTSEELFANKFGAAVQMDIIKIVLDDQIQLLKYHWRTLMLDVMETKKMSAELVRENSYNTEKMEGLISEVASLKAQNMAAEDALSALTQELSHNDEQLQLLRTHTEEAQLRCDHLVSHSSYIEEKFSLDIFLLALEEAILKDMLVSQDGIIEKESTAFRRRMQEKVDALTLENGGLVSKVKSVLEVAQLCSVESKRLIAELTNYGEQIMESKVERLARDGIIVYQQQAMEHEGEPETVSAQDRENMHSIYQRIDCAFKALLAMKKDLKNCRFEVGVLVNERNQLLSEEKHREHVYATLCMEIEKCFCEFKNMQLSLSELDECGLFSIGFSKTCAKLLTEAKSIATEVKGGQSLLLEKLLQKENEMLLMQFKLQQTSDSLTSLEKIHSLCEGSFLQILKQEREKSKEELNQKEISESHLQSQLSHVSELVEKFKQMYNDTSNQLLSKNLEMEQLQQQHQDSLQLICSLHEEKKLTTGMSKMMLTDMMYQSAPGDASQNVTDSFVEKDLTNSKDSLFDVEKLKLSNQELKTEVERQRGDMECLQRELQESCDIVSEVKCAHSKTVEMLHESEKQLANLSAEVEAKCAHTCALETDVLFWQNQNTVLEQENQKLNVQLQKLEKDLSFFRLFQSKIMKFIDDQEIKLLALQHDFDWLLALDFTEGNYISLIRVFEDCELMLDNIETLIHLCSKVAKELEVSQAYLMNMGLTLESQTIQIRSLSDRIVDLERDKDYLQEEKRRRDAAIEKLQLRSQQQENVQDVLKATHEGSEKTLEVVEGNEMKLTGLQRKIQRMTEWLSQEIGNDCKLAFTEGCELVLKEVEREVQTCREQTEIAWKKTDAVLDEKRQIEDNLLERDEMVKNLQIEIAVLQDHVGIAKEFNGMEELNFTIRKLKGELDDKQLQLDKLEDELSNFQQSSNIGTARLVEMEEQLSEQKECLALLEVENSQLRSQLHELTARKEVIEVDLADKEDAIQILDMQLLNLNSLIEQRKAFSLDHINHDLNRALRERDLAIKERDELHADLVVLNEQLEMAQQLAEEHEAIAVEARQIAERSKTRAEQKEEEAKLLERSVEELESTVNALETQVGLVKSDTERQRLMREDTEMELQALRHQMSIMQAHQVETGCDWEQIQRDLETKSAQLMKTEEQIQLLEKQLDEKDEQIRRYKKDLVEIMSEAEKQASDHHQIIRTLENMAELRPIVQVPSNSKLADRSSAKPRASGSPFKCIGSGLSHQMSYEIDEELSSNRQKIEELEALANSRQKEIFMLNVRLAEAESMTHDVIRDLVGVKLDITNYATLMNLEQLHTTAVKSVLHNEQGREKDKELTHLKTQLNAFIEERESWLEEINRRQAEMMTARVAAEKLRQRDQLLSTENETLKMENTNQRNRIFELEEEVNKLSGQQNLQQRIHHHAKIKEENNQLRMKNEDLATKLRRSEVLLLRVGEELARYREAEGKTPYIDVEEEQRLKIKLQEVEEEKIQIAQELLTLCTNVLQVAGLTSSRGIDHTVAAEALKHLQDRLDAAEREVSDMKLKNKIESEKRHLSELRSLHSPLARKNFAATQQCSSPHS